ncbi:MAG TPA: hypothetical protein VIU64_03535 [Polyangia bacterium]
MSRSLAADRRPFARWWSRSAPLLAVIALALAPAAGCRRSHVAGTPSTDVVLGAFRDAGLDVTGVANAEADSFGADVCSSGKISGVDVVICEFTSDAQLGKTQADAVRDWNSANIDTGLVAVNQRTLLIVADRGRNDPHGRAIAKMVTAFKGVQ